MSMVHSSVSSLSQQNSRDNNDNNDMKEEEDVRVKNAIKGADIEVLYNCTLVSDNATLLLVQLI